MAKSKQIIRVGRADRSILMIRGQRVILDADLADLFGIPTWRLNEQVKRNRARFPSDFRFTLKRSEWEILKSQIAISSDGWGGRRTLPLAFTEHGCIMAANVVNSPRAVRASILIVRAFVQLREVLATNKELSHKMEQLERRVDTHDKRIIALFEAIRELMTPPTPAQRKRIGYATEVGS